MELTKVTITEEKKMTVAERKAKMPYALMADGSVVAVVKKDEQETLTGRTTCPNCKFVYDLPQKSTAPAPFSIQHP